MKLISTELLAHLQQDATTLCTCVKLTRRDGVVLAYTTHDRPLTFDCDGLGAITYKAEGAYKRSALESQLGLTADTVELEGLLQDDAIDEDDILNGLYDHAELKVMLVNWSNVTQGVLKLRRGYVGRITLHRDTYVAEIKGLMDRYSTVIGELYTPDCRADLGDTRCQFPLEPPAWQPNHEYPVNTAFVSATGGAHPTRVFQALLGGTSGATEPTWDTALLGSTPDGSMSWHTILAYTVPCTVTLVETVIPGEAGTYKFQVEALPEFTAWPTTAALTPWFQSGEARWLTGANAGTSGEIKAWFPATTPGSTVHLTLATALPIQVGDTLQLVAGCDKRRLTCVHRFRNIVNFRGEPWIPGLDTALLYPSPHPV